VFIIADCSSSVGLASARLALENGGQVLGVNVSALPAEFEGNAAYRSMQCDLTERGAADAIVSKALSAFGGRIDGFFNIVRVRATEPVTEECAWTDEIRARSLHVNLTSPIRLMRAVMNVMKQQEKGSVVNFIQEAEVLGEANIAHTASTTIILSFEILRTEADAVEQVSTGFSIRQGMLHRVSYQVALGATQS
jgi:NAD(P)-dependent dehydrogenase (short-subunit alcohol dehydrogenase family)